MSSSKRVNDITNCVDFPLYPTREDRPGVIRVALDFARSFQLNGQQSDILTALERVKVPLASFVSINPFRAGRCRSRQPVASQGGANPTFYNDAAVSNQ